MQLATAFDSTSYGELGGDKSLSDSFQISTDGETRRRVNI